MSNQTIDPVVSYLSQQSRLPYEAVTELLISANEAVIAREPELQALYDELLGAGVRIIEYASSFLHAG